MSTTHEECSSSLDIPEDGWLATFLNSLAALNGTIFVFFCLFVGPINVAVNLLVMFVLTRKQLRSTYNFVFFLMALDQTIIIGTLTIFMFKTAVFIECRPWFFSLFWALFDLILNQQLIVICKAHATWLAVIIAFMRLMSIRSHGASELQLNLVILICSAALLFVVIVNTPNFFSFTTIWISFELICETKEFGDLLIPLTMESPEIYKNDCLMMRLTSLLTGVLHSAVPCLLLIILTFILLRFLRKARKDRETMILNKSTAQDGDKTTTLLILIMISTMISEIPQAIISILEGLLSTKMRTQVSSKISEHETEILIL
ncbi:hypothetical protein PRIPAC_76751 [Pristionchus pacificus]|nr:hypothetical protein PRIPAC_76751 [Pristionchus pacificus]